MRRTISSNYNHKLRPAERASGGRTVYDATTHSIRVAVEPNYLDDQSSPEDDYYVWSYRVVIENQSGSTVKLHHRHWRITDAAGKTQEVHGEGVVGEQPVLNPGERFEYTSGAPLQTPSGIMAGIYQMSTDDGTMLDVTIPAFSLDSPFGRRTIN